MTSPQTRPGRGVPGQNTHQLHSVENMNRRLRNLAAGRTHVNLSDGTEYSPFDIGARATVVPVRDFEIKVKHRINDYAEQLDLVDDPVNILGPVFLNQIPLITNNDPSSLMAAFNKRCNFQQQGPSDDISDKQFVAALAAIAALRKNEDQWDENPVDRARWLSKFDSSKRERMEQAWLDIPEATLRDIRNKTIMVKIEPLLKREDESWGPRAVYVGSDAHNAITGPAMMIAMERLVAALDTDNDGEKLGNCHIKFGYKSSDVALCEFLLRDSNLTHPLEGDYSRNDREQRSRVALIIDMWLSRLNMPDWVRKLMLDSSEEYDVYLPAAGLKATLKHQLPTGTTATTFRNSAFNAVMFCVAAHEQGVRNARCLILGDDLLAVTDKKMDLHVWEQCIDKFKMVLKAAAPDLEGCATFLSRRLFVYCDVPCMVPKIGKALARFNVRASRNTGVSNDAYMAGKALSYGHEFRHVPFFRKHFMLRYQYHWDRMSESERSGDIINDSLTWSTRVAGLDDRKKLLAAIANEKVTIPDSYLRDWMVDTYQIGLVDSEYLFTLMISKGIEYGLVDHPAYDNLAIDF